MSNNNATTEWRRVNKAQPCFVCGKPSWCCISVDGTAAICGRIETGSIKRCGEAGWLHRASVVLRSRPTTTTLGVPVPRSLKSQARMTVSSGEYVMSRMHWRTALVQHAQSLGVTVESLCRLEIGWATEFNAWSFPMKDDGGHIVGIRLRQPSGRKFAEPGGREGLFIPADLCAGGPLLVCEGPTDTAAMLDLGFDAVGRPSCRGGVRLLTNALRRWNRPEVIVVADADGPGRNGGNYLATALAAYCRSVRIITPPSGLKDARDWKRRGATSDDVHERIASAPMRKLTVAAALTKGSKREVANV
jgi:hypothetical protein